MTNVDDALPAGAGHDEPADRRGPPGPPTQYGPAGPNPPGGLPSGYLDKGYFDGKGNIWQSLVVDDAVWVAGSLSQKDRQVVVVATRKLRREAEQQNQPRSLIAPPKRRKRQKR